MKKRLQRIPPAFRYLLGSVSAMSLVLGAYRLAETLFFP